MKSIIFKTLVVFVTIFLTLSCSKDDDPTPVVIPTKALLGLFDMKINGTIDSNLLFENGNRVTYGFPTITDMLSQSGRRSTYTLTNNEITFSNSDGGTTYNYKCTYEPITGKLVNGTFGTGASFGNAGTFTAQKHLPASSGDDLYKGYWIGTYNNGSVSTNSPWNVTLEEGGKIVLGLNGNSTFTGSFIGSGTYTISGNSISANYTIVSSSGSNSFTGTYNPSAKKITGTWTRSDGLSGGGFTLDMKNAD
jgi:hypothetical protein